MKKTERQNGIVHLLKARKKMNANELAEYFEVSERTIYRDIDALSQLRVPIIAHEGFGGGYEIDSSFFMPSIKLTEHEILMLLMVLKAGEELRIPNMSTDYNLLRGKVFNVLSDMERQKAEQILAHIEFDIIRIIPRGYSCNVINPLLEAFAKTCNLNINYYHPERDDVECRKLSPSKLFFADGVWYLKGYCHLRKAKRTFRLDRIISIECLDEKNVHKDIELPTEKTDKFTLNTYELVIDYPLYRIIMDNDYLRYSEAKEVDGKVCLTVKTRYKQEILQLALNHPEQVTVVKPEEFVREIKKLGQAICEKYLK